MERNLLAPGDDTREAQHSPAPHVELAREAMCVMWPIIRDRTARIDYRRVAQKRRQIVDETIFALARAGWLCRPNQEQGREADR